ncbi:hypothetical protein D5F51_07785 [Yersinia hibernica]|uniref:Uncharacterized protein n=1 Tax=Yersinia hibernica TaxID=2339259 RepID=A0ABX5QYK8_9GAMM|nr:hypothetical protein D5F51_07785 [Yersinia hibernica]
MLILANNDLHYDLLLLSGAGCIAISTGSTHNKFPFPCSNGYWNAALIVYAIGAFYFGCNSHDTSAISASHIPFVLQLYPLNTEQ